MSSSSSDDPAGPNAGQASETELEDLADFLMSDRAPPDCMGLSDLDGFLTALVIGPSPVEPQAWLPIVWGDEEPSFADRAEAEKMIRVIMQRFEEIATMLRESPEDHSPILIEDSDGEILYEHWAGGFLAAVSLQPDAWAPLFEDEEAISLMLPLIVAGGEEGAESIGLAPEAEETLKREMPEYLPLAILGIQGFWDKIRHH
ncbi:UPF0149 family protein [Fodinicurvata sp. EGI_FJ10296]|uniref:UPF0149 family protein n=1 Tax=Fodinicurvata sp. EGI_FJ10296 TaxID=3231908 RepID=UPI003456FB11